MATAASEPPMVEQVITEFFAKSLHIILESRSPYESSRNFTRPSPPSSPLSGSQPRDRWFNLALRDCPAALENFDLWRQSNLEPLVIDIVLLHRNNTSTTSAGAGKIIERWVIQYETRKSGSGNDTDSKNNDNVSKNNGRKPRNSSAVDHSLYWSTYQGTTVLLRSLYLVVRLLPAYNIFRELTSSGRICPLNLSHTISFVEQFARAEDAEMKRYAFSQIETLFGRLSLSVSYVPVLEVVAAPEPTTTMPMELIMDYIGSPATVFLKKFNSLPSQCSFRADFSDREDQVTNQDAGGSLTRTPAADVEALVRMLKTAPGLRECLPSIAAPLVPQEPSSVQRVVTEEHGNVTSSSAVVPSLLGSITAADALEELKKYKEIRESILNRGKTQPQDTELGEKPTNGDP